MNKVILIGRLTDEPSCTTNGDLEIAKYTLAVDNKNDPDFIDCVAFGKSAKFVKDYLHKGTKIALDGRIRSGSYTNREGKKIYTFDVIVEHHEFCESKRASESSAGAFVPTEFDPFAKEAMS